MQTKVNWNDKIILFIKIDLPRYIFIPFTVLMNIHTVQTSQKFLSFGRETNVEMVKSYKI